ncbi:hypothetical protein [Thermococcus aciditolerans]|uniref:Uncharacterized protein n=1 Tax=Thermococcus aciditolerans TaxID=2598455 RepID=A0A5C0SPJ1_9EURY|nr:hypothetical protein [Thermococcus aciditolerans]QEK15108.1 hypothetical protein FPV09_08380 [Thermococcus aciditolerans]
MKTVIVTDRRRHLLHPLLVASASRVLHRGNLRAFEAVAEAFERNYFFERVVRMPMDCFGKYLEESILLGVQAGFNRLDELLPAAEGEGVRLIETGDEWVPFYTAARLYADGKPVPAEILRHLPNPEHLPRDGDYLRFMVKLIEHNHRFGTVSCAFEFWALREALSRKLWRPKGPKTWRGRGCFVGVTRGKGDINDVRGELKLFCRNGWCLFYFRGSEKRLKEKLKERGLSPP